jgi:hypothetical protein
MTCIAGVLKGNALCIGGDAAGSAGHHVVVQAQPKVFKRGEFIIGYTTSFRMGQLLQHVFEPPAPYDWEQDVHAYMVCRFVPALRGCLKDGGFASKDKEVESGGHFLVGVRRRLFEIQSDYQVAEPAPLERIHSLTRMPPSLMTIAAVGCGAPYALGAMYAAAKVEGLGVGEIVRAGLKAAEMFSGAVRQPFSFESTE